MRAIRKPLASLSPTPLLRPSFYRQQPFFQPFLSPLPTNNHSKAKITMSTSSPSSSSNSNNSKNNNNVSAGFLLPPLNLPAWLSTNSHLLQPPINNHCVYHDPLTVMIVGGPNARTDYHINATPEFFYQHKGRMLLKTVQPNNEHVDVFRDIYINQGDLFLLPAGIPHNPVRFRDTVGIVIEQPRPEGVLDRLRWYCRRCGGVVCEKGFVCTDLGKQIKEAVLGFERDREARTCGRCGEVCETKPTEEEMGRMEREEA